MENIETGIGETSFVIETRRFGESRWILQLGEYRNKQSAVKRAKDEVSGEFGFAQARVIKTQVVALFNNQPEK